MLSDREKTNIQSETTLKIHTKCLSVEQGRTRHGVALEVVVDVELDARVALLVQLLAGSTGRRGITTTGNLDVDALHVVLGTIGLSSRVQGNQLMTENIVSISHGLRNRKGVRVVVLDHVVTGPSTWGVAAVNQTLLVDLEELQAGLVGLGAVAVARSQVVQDRAVVTLGPLGPLQFDLGAGLHVGSQGTGLCVLVADNVGRLVFAGRHESEISSVGRPANGLGRVVRVGVLVDKVAAVAVSC